MLQEVHCTENNVHLWTAEWGYKALFSCCSSKKAGTCTPFNNNFDLQINKTRSDPNGRFIICDINTNGTSFTLCNLYAPNEDRPEFFRDISNYLQDFQRDEIIIGGDFSLVMDIKKDKRGSALACIKTPSKRLKEFARRGMSETYGEYSIKKKKDTLGDRRNRIFNVGSISFWQAWA